MHGRNRTRVAVRTVNRGYSGDITMVVEMYCPKCGHRMRLMEHSDWQLFDVRTYKVKCPNCGHIERVKMLAARRMED